jgi:hypothetical protein
MDERPPKPHLKRLFGLLDKPMDHLIVWIGDPTGNSVRR